LTAATEGHCLRMPNKMVEKTKKKKLKPDLIKHAELELKGFSQTLIFKLSRAPRREMVCL